MKSLNHFGSPDVSSVPEPEYGRWDSQPYFYDADAVREADGGFDHPRSVLNGQPSLEPSGGLMRPHVGLRTTEGRNGSGRNLRSVWTIATQPWPGAHFATFPEALVEPCVKAGCPEGGVVLDPFAGTGTVGLVAQRLSRRAILIDLNPEYLRQCLARNAQTPLGLVSEVPA
jgi:DNA modification methylase